MADVNLSNLSGVRTKLLFATNRSALRAKYPDREVDRFFHDLESRVRLVDVNTSRPVEVADRIRASIGDAPGVVLLGGYDVIPSQRTSCVPAGSTAKASDDPDEGFVVWCDDIYGDVDGDGLPELPVSRVPDAGRFEFLVTCLNAPELRPSPPYALINKLRPFADQVVPIIADAIHGTVQHSVPVNVQSDQNPQPDWSGHRVGYLMLHGRSEDGTLFRGQFDRVTYIEALRTRDVPALAGGFVFAGCCWGALIVDAPAAIPPGPPLRSRSLEESIALTALDRGAVAFIGSTGLVQSPDGWSPQAGANRPNDYYCKPLHAAFWRRCAQGLAPAQALLEAKLDYFVGIPYPGGSDGVSDIHIATEIKQFREMTCLGLGW